MKRFLIDMFYLVILVAALVAYFVIVAVERAEVTLKEWD